MDELLVEAARDYNAPGSVPREEMWERFSAATRCRGRWSRRSQRTVWRLGVVRPGRGRRCCALPGS